MFTEMIDILESSADELEKLDEKLQKFQEEELSHLNQKLDSNKNPEEKIKVAKEILSAIGDLEKGALKNSFNKKIFRDVYYLPNTLKKRVSASDQKVQKSFQSFLQNLDQLIYYNLVILNCQQLRFLGQKKLSQTVIDSKGYTLPLKAEKGLEPLALLSTGKEIHNLILPKYQAIHPTLSKSFTEFIKNIKFVKSHFDKITKLLNLIDMSAENMSEIEQTNFYTRLNSYTVAPTDVVKIATDLLFKECQIRDAYDLNYYLNDETSKKHIDALAVMLLTEIIRFHHPTTNLDSFGYYSYEGFLGLKKKYLSKSEIFTMISDYEQNKSRYSINNWWIDSLSNLTDNDVWEFTIRKHNKE
jgi:hypothetical protein